MKRYPEANSTRLLIKCSKTAHLNKPNHGPLAQLVEQLTFNQRVAGSSPARLTTPSLPDAIKVAYLILNQPPKTGPAGFSIDISFLTALDKLATALSGSPLVVRPGLVLLWVAAGGGEFSPVTSHMVLPQYALEVTQ